MPVEVTGKQARRLLAVLGVFVSLSLAPSLAATPDGAGGPRGVREDEVPAYPPVTNAETVLGRIEIPRVGVSAPILEGVDDATIRRAVGHFPETPMPSCGGNVALAAHRTTDFYGLRNIRIGDEVTVTTRRGAFRYRVERMWVVAPDDVWVLEPSPGRVLTLVTCYPFDYRGAAPERFIVRAAAVDSAPALQGTDRDAPTRARAEAPAPARSN